MTAVTSETEIKLCIGDLQAARVLIESQGFQVSVPEVFERNVVLDSAAGEFRASGQLLRLRLAGNLATLTFKGVAAHGKHKVREERETAVASFDEMLIILERLGYREVFVYEKYRTEFQSKPGGVITLDETPAGNFLELEGEAAWIDVTASLLGFSETDYSTASYGTIYAQLCKTQGITPTNMTFNRPRSVPARKLSQP